MSLQEILHATDCPDENMLAAYMGAELGPAEAERVVAHLDTCAVCHRLMGTIARACVTTGETGPLSPPIPHDPHTEVVSRLQQQRPRLKNGAALGRYVIREPIGEGGMGVVYAARDPDLERDVAIKVVTPALGDSPTQRRRLLREARAAARLQHPNVVAIYDVDRQPRSRRQRCPPPPRRRRQFRWTRSTSANEAPSPSPRKRARCARPRLVPA